MSNRAVRPIRIEGEVAYIPLTQGYEAVIDAADAPLVEGFNWYALVQVRTVYACRTDCSTGRHVTIYLHRVLMAAPAGLEVDHRDGHGLNNRKKNLRVATHAQNERNQRLNSANTSGFKGASFHAGARRWQAHIRVDGRRHYLGLFDTPEAAHAAYTAASAEFHGEFGRTA
jgi:hypothetical protein